MSSKLYIPRSAIHQEDVRSLVNLIASSDAARVDMHGARRAALKYLLAFQAVGIDLSIYIDLNFFETLKQEINDLNGIDRYKGEFDENGDTKFEEYWELYSKSHKIHKLAKDARHFTNKDQCFKLEQLKVYFNPKQIENIPYSQATFESSGFADNDARQSMGKYPVNHRHNKGEIHTVQGRIEEAVFHVPVGKQVIVLDFADERMPGGLFLYGATTQEETICYNSDAYRGLLDFKYKLFDGGFLIPEFGCLYIKRCQFFKPGNPSEHRPVDIIAAACYDFTCEHGLYKKPSNDDEAYANTEKKLQTVIAAAQANSDEDGKNTYLILGPIGCGAFQNDLNKIAKIWAHILLHEMYDGSSTEQRHAFENVWFLSGKEDKLEVFEREFHLDKKQRLKYGSKK